MKKVFMTLIAAAMMTAVMAQDNNGAQQRGPRMNRAEMIEKRTQQMAEKYGLSAEQTEKLKALNEKQLGNMGRGNRGEQGGQRQRPQADSQTDGQTGATAQQNPQANGQRQRPQMGQRGNGQGGQRGGRGFRGGFDMTKYNEELKAILTPEQYSAYEADMAKMREARQSRRPQQ